MSDNLLSEDQARFYQRNGFVQIRDALSPEELKAARESLSEVCEMKLGPRQDLSAGRPEYEKLFVQKVNLWTIHEGMRQLVHSPKLAEMARRLAGVSRIRLWHDHALIKNPGDSRESPWHQDLPYWPMREPGALSCWLALDDVDERNGCMQFIPESHLWGRFEPIRLVGDTQDIFSFVPDREPIPPAVMKMPAGSCTYHHGLTFHYAFPNRTDSPRRAMVIIYMPDRTTFNGRGHVVTDGLGLVAGEPIAGDLFPILAQSPPG